MRYGLANTQKTDLNCCMIIGCHHQTKEILWQTDAQNKLTLSVHCGESKNWSLETLVSLLQDIMQHILKQSSIENITLDMPMLPHATPAEQLCHMLLTVDAACYDLQDFKTQDKKTRALKSVNFFIPQATLDDLHVAESIASSIQTTKNLANRPANHCTPGDMAEAAEQLDKSFSSIKTTVFNVKKITKMGMGALLAVGQGSHEPPQFIEIQYRGAHKSEAPIVLIGKGITFDSGGISLKPADGMNEMKYDMCGAASVLGTVKACALLKLPINVVGLLACAENMPGGGAIKPGDIIKTMNGQTVEIVNTDAEGRLVMADALTYAERFNPRFVIDIATLTGAIIVALGRVSSGLMTKDEDLAKLILKAGQVSGDKVWQLPLDDAYQEALESPLADMINSSFDRSAGSITAACFLSRFAKKFRWAHLDIAGTAWRTGKKNHATGRPVPLLITLLRHVADAR